MTNGIIIPLGRSKRLMRKAQTLLKDPNLLFEDSDHGITILIDALPHADQSSLLKMLPLLAYAGRDRVLWPIYRLMFDRSHDGHVRNAAAIQLGMAASLSGDPSMLNRKLVENLDHPEPAIRSGSAMALGWPGNDQVVDALLAHMDDDDSDVQTAMVTALTSIGGDRVFDRLNLCLTSGDTDLKRNIILNLWRFSDYGNRVERIYLDGLEDSTDDLRADLLAGLAMLPPSTTIMECYERFLYGDDPDIKCQILQNLMGNDPADYAVLNDCLNTLLSDKHDHVRQMAIRLQRL